MEPNEKPIVPSVENNFSLVVDGQICIGYRYQVYTMDNKLVTAASTGRLDLEAALYSDETLVHTVAKDLFAAGNTYKWQMDLYAVDLTVTSVDTTANTLKVVNHNLLTGDTVYVASDDTLPGGLTAFTKYYIRKVDKDTIALFSYIEGARNDSGRISLTSTGAGSIVVSNIVQSEQAVFGVYDMPEVVFESEEIHSPAFTFKPTYTHPQDIMVNHWEAIITTEDRADSESSGLIYRSKIVS